MMGDRFVFVMQGAHGATSAEGTDERGNRLSLSSHVALPTFVASHGADIVDGSPVVDLTPIADRVGLVRLAFDAPMIDLRLTDVDDVDRWDGDTHGADPLRIAPMLAGAYFGAAGVLAASRTTTSTPGPFDQVSPGRVAAYWREHGAHVGSWSADTQSVVWS